MIDSISDAVVAALQSQVAGGVFVLSVVGAAIAMLRNVPAKLIALIRRRLITTVDIPGNNPLFDWLVVWLDAHPYSRRARLLTATAKPRLRRRQGERDEGPTILFSPAPGNHLLWYGRRPIWLTRERKDTPGKDGFAPQFQETLTLRTISRDPGVLRALLLEAHTLASENREHISIYASKWSDWTRLAEVKPRPLASVMLPAGVMENIVADAQEFLESEEWYAERGIPWRRGYLLAGLPGSGKSSSIAALAGQLRLDLYVCNLADKALSDSSLTSMLLEVPARSILLLEDIDAVVQGREIDSDNGVTFAGLLNALDGVAARPGILTFMTTNHVEKLDPALIRSGRVDQRITFGPATEEQLARLFLHFYNGTADEVQAAAFAHALAGCSMADAQAVLLEHKRDPPGAVRRSIKVA